MDGWFNGSNGSPLKRGTESLTHPTSRRWLAGIVQSYGLASTTQLAPLLKTLSDPELKWWPRHGACVMDAVDACRVPRSLRTIDAGGEMQTDVESKKNEGGLWK
jgi:hypothetical protein